MSLTIRPVRGPAEWRICRALLPDACAHSAGIMQGLLAVQSSAPAVAGAAVLHYDEREVWLHLHVVHTQRRSGAGSQLLRAALDAAALRDAHRAIAVCDTVAEPAAQPFLAGFGFAPKSRFTTFEVEFRKVAPLLEAARNRLAARQCIPPSARLVTLPEAPAQEVAQLYATYIAGRADLQRAPLKIEGDLNRWRHSPVLLVDGKVVGVLLGDLIGDTAVIAARIVAEEFQGGRGWANALLLGMASDRARQVSLERFRFESTDDNTDTLKLARRMNAEVVSVKTRFEKTLVEPLHETA